MYFYEKGGVEESLDFAMGQNTGAYWSCSATLKGELLVFGGYESTNKKQVINFK